MPSRVDDNIYTTRYPAEFNERNHLVGINTSTGIEPAPTKGAIWRVVNVIIIVILYPFLYSGAARATDRDPCACHLVNLC